MADQLNDEERAFLTLLFEAAAGVLLDTLVKRLPASPSASALAFPAITPASTAVM